MYGCHLASQIFLFCVFSVFSVCSVVDENLTTEETEYTENTELLLLEFAGSFDPKLTRSM